MACDVIKIVVTPLVPLKVIRVATPDPIKVIRVATPVTVKVIRVETSVPVKVIRIAAPDPVKVIRIGTSINYVGPPGPQGLQGPEGLQGLQGMVGPSGQSHKHVQSVAASVWFINHVLGFKPNITAFDSDMPPREVEGNIEHIDINNATISFIGGFTGEAYCS